MLRQALSNIPRSPVVHLTGNVRKNRESGCHYSLLGRCSQVRKEAMESESLLMPCKACQSRMSKEAPYCPTCAHPNPLTAYDGPVKSRIVAALLAIFFGGFGIHRFYMNEPKIALVYILFVWTFIPVIIGVIEGLIYIFQTDDQFRARRKRALSEPIKSDFTIKKSW